MPEETYVIVGASLAGARAAQTLREEGFAGAIVLIGDELHRPYERPRLSKGYLLGADPRDTIFVHEPAWYAEHDVTLRLGAMVQSLSRGAKKVGFANGSTVGYDKLLIATGCSPRRLSVPGGGLRGVLHLRTVDDSEVLATMLRAGGQVVIIGAGWIGLETAAAARHYGCEVTVVEPEPGPLQRSIGPELGEMFASLHRGHGVVFRFGEGVSELRGDGRRVREVVTSAEARLPADVVVVGIGAQPNTDFAARAGLETDNGICVSEALATSDPDIFAAGDVANAVNPVLGRRARVEHWGNALAAGPVAARSMLGQPASHDLVPYFFSYQYDLWMETAGLPEPGSHDRVVYRGDSGSLEFIAFWLKGSSVIAGMNVNVRDVNDAIQALIRSGAPVDAARLADPDVPLTDLAG